MNTLNLKIITPKKVVLEESVISVTAPGVSGEFTVLPRHVPLFATLQEGIVTIRDQKNESFFSIGGGYIETDGKDVHLLVSRAFGQDEIDEKEIEQARTRAEKLLKESRDESERHEALLVLRRSLVDMKLLKKTKHRKQVVI